MGKVVKLTEKKLTELINKVIKEASITTFDSWYSLENIKDRKIAIGSDGTLQITNNQNKPIKIKFSGKLLFTSISINVGRIDESGNQLIITTKQSKRQTFLGPNHVSALLSFVDNPKQTVANFNGVKVREPNSQEEKTGDIIAEKV